MVEPLFVDTGYIKKWDMVDCLSFVVMREMKLTTALAFDKHFEQAGFRVLEISK